MYIKQVFMVSINTEQDSIPVGCTPPACQPYMFRWPLLDVSTGGSAEVGPQVNKFEQVSSDDHQMSVAGEDGGRSPRMMWGGVTLPCDLPHDAYDVPTTPSLNGMTDACEDIIFQLCLRVIIISD